MEVTIEHIDKRLQNLEQGQRKTIKWVAASFIGTTVTIIGISSILLTVLLTTQ